MAAMLPRRPGDNSASAPHPAPGLKKARKSSCDEDIEVPSKFGNAADYWKHFDHSASARNQRMVDGMNQNLDLLLVFGGLFAAVNSGFLTFAVPMLNADPAAQTNHLLRLLITGGTNQTNITEAELQPPSFTPPNNAILIGRLFSVSLTLTLLASFGAMVGKQWMIYYNKSSQGGPSEMESRNLLRMLAGVNRCGLRFLVELALPSLLQIALIVFSVGVIKYLQTLNNDVAWVNAILAWLGIGVFGVTVIHAVWDPYCPFQTPISHFLWFVISLPFDMIPGAVLVLVKRFPKKLIKKTTGGLFNAFLKNWNHPIRLFREQRQIVANTVDSSYMRTLSHRLKFDPFSQAVSRIQRGNDSNDVMDAKYTCHILRKMHQPEILRAVAQSIPTLFDRKAVTILLRDRAVVQLHRLFRESIAQAEDSPDALAQDSDDDSNPAVNSALYGRAIVHCFIALGPHDDWFWDDYELPLHRGWLDPWDFLDDEAPKVKEELGHQRRLIQACLSIDVDHGKPAPSTDIEVSALPVYIAASIKALLYRRVYNGLAHYPPKFRPTVNNWTGEVDLERIAFCPVFPSDFPKVIGLVAWALATVPKRLSGDLPALEKYKQYWADLKELWDAYSSTSNILPNLVKALEEYPRWISTNHDPSKPRVSATEIKNTYAAMLQAATPYIQETAIRDDIENSSRELFEWTDRLRKQIPSEDRAVIVALRSVADAIAFRLGKRIHLHQLRAKSTYSEGQQDGGQQDVDQQDGDLEEKWFDGETPAAVEEYAEWLTAHRSSYPGKDSREVFLETFRDRQSRRPTMQGIEISEKPRSDG